MKKVLVVFMISCMTIGMISCSDNSPRGVAEQGIKCLKKKDYSGFVDLMQYFEDKSGEEKEYYASMVEANSRGEIESYNIIDEIVDEEAGTAKITYVIFFSNGDRRTDCFYLVKNDRGKWKIK